MKTTVLFFAGLREYAGQAEMELELSSQACVKDVVDVLKEKGFNPEFFHHLLFAVNETYATFETPLFHGDTVALISPVAGG